MKKIKLILGVAFIGSILVISCQKEKITNAENLSYYGGDALNPSQNYEKIDTLAKLTIEYSHSISLLSNAAYCNYISILESNDSPEEKILEISTEAELVDVYARLIELKDFFDNNSHFESVLQQSIYQDYFVDRISIEFGLDQVVLEEITIVNEHGIEEIITVANAGCDIYQSGIRGCGYSFATCAAGAILTGVGSGGWLGLVLYAMCWGVHENCINHLNLQHPNCVPPGSYKDYSDLMSSKYQLNCNN